MRQCLSWPLQQGRPWFIVFNLLEANTVRLQMNVTRLTSIFVRLSRLAIAIAGVALFVPTQPARAQNLITDPYFANGLAANQSQTPDGTVYSVSATAGTLNQVTGINIAQGGYFEIVSIPGYDPNNVNYMFSLFAAALDPNQPTNFFAEFGSTTGSDSCGECGSSSISAMLTTTLTQYTITGTSTGGGYIFAEPTGGGGIFITGLDLEAAPSPVPGGGILSFGAVFAGLAAYRIRPRIRA